MKRLAIIALVFAGCHDAVVAHDDWVDVVALLVMAPFLSIGIIGVTAARRERQRRKLRCCPVCRGRDMVRALARPPRDQPHYRRIANTYRCASCGGELFEPLRGRYAGPLTGEQIDQRLVASNLPPATLRRR